MNFGKAIRYTHGKLHELIRHNDYGFISIDNNHVGILTRPIAINYKIFCLQDNLKQPDPARLRIASQKRPRPMAMSPSSI